MVIATQGVLKEFELPYAVVEDGNIIYQTEIGPENPPRILWGNATITDFEHCFDPREQSIIYL